MHIWGLREMLLEVEGLEIRYGRVPAVRDLTFGIAEGEFVCFVGPNGVGKSTTTLAVAGVVQPAKGSIRFDGHPLAGTLIETIVSKGIALVPEGRRIFGRMSVRENLVVASGVRGGLGRKRAVLDRILELFPILRQRFESPAGFLSGGEQQQLAIARALLTEPKLLVVDEPSLGLAPKYVELVYETFSRIRSEGVTLLIVEQSVRRALKYADRICFMQSGRIVLEGNTPDLAQRTDLELVYFGEGKRD
ncbi:ABC transporter ATP-binding protein [Neoaquamicrobium sediminum]|uniref:ABC transporter ATP-binding protein n=1 Tax=Neoaquamicrobium sediminum TaxID=1849104 RepID=UPI001563BDB3|nr:ABC transporter ATP-binding protein [Mesorhizobium sediminum]NRC57259.1 ABC transporter ATP-binding protein [Mesorhizobium sediminum]